MTRPFRLRPPDAGDAILRPGLLRRLLPRFDARVMVLRASGGFGKTTALSQAVAQNLLAPRGIDVWIGCEEADADADHFRKGLAEALGLSTDADPAAIADAVTALSPRPVCLILDDAHEIPPGSGGASVIEDLVAGLPANGHLLLASRIEPPVNLARLDAQGRILRLDEHDLALTDPELATLASRAGRPVADISHLGGWPALVALGLRSGPVAQFIDEEVLGSLELDQREVLGALVALGGANEPILRQISGTSPSAALASLPMIQQVDGWYRPHALWLEVFPAEMLTDIRAHHLRDAVEHLLETGPVERAVDLACRSDAPDLVVRALREAVIAGRVEDRDVLRRWLAAVTEDTVQHPIVTHISGLIEQAADPTTERSRDLFQRAAEGFAALGDTEAQVSALAEVAFWHHIQRDAAGLQEVAASLMAIAGEGEPAAAPYVEMIGAFVALAQGDADAMFAAIRRSRSLAMTGRFQAIADWLEYQAGEFIGISNVELADRYLSGTGGVRGTEVIAISSRWRAGRVKEILDDLHTFAPRTGSERARFLSHAWLSVVYAGCGNLTAARSHLEQAERMAGEAAAKQVVITLETPRALILHEEGRAAEAEACLRDLVARIPITDDTRLSYNPSGALIVRVEPTALDALSHPLPRRDTDLGYALRHMDETGELSAIAALDWPEEPGRLLSSIFLRTTCELVCAAWAIGRPEARPTVEWLLDVVGSPARERLRDHTNHPHPKVAGAAKEILTAVPLPPGETRQLQLFGSERLLIGSVESDHEDWRRERVRSLLAYLVVHPENNRDVVMTALWPEASEDAARRNLRSTLNLLLGVLEEARGGGDAAYFVRSDGNRLRLAGHDRLDVDLWRFDSLLDEADQLEADGAPSLALECLREATDLYRGDFLTGAIDCEWLDLERQRLHVRFVSAAVRGAELMLAHDQVDEAVALASRTIQVEPWSEPAHRALVAAHLQRGDRAAAHRAMQRCHEVLAELGGPVDELTEMLERRLTGS